MRSREFESKTVEEAISDGLRAMDLSLEEVTVQILEEGSKGLFGLIGAKPARVRMTEKPPVALDEEEKPGETAPPPPPRVKAPETSAPRPKERQPMTPLQHPQQEKRPALPKREPERPQTAVVEEKETDSGTAGAFVMEVAKRMELDVTVKAYLRDETLRIDILGDDKGILIGHRGETLDALQYLTSLVHNKDKEPYERLQLDSQNYRRKREETLVRLANRLADKAKRTRHRVTLEPMNPYERRILHSALQGNPHVTTHSEGDEPNRRVVIQPK